MALLIGAVLALLVGWFAAAVRLDRDRAFYPVVTIVVASYYALFAAMGAAPGVLVLETLVGAVFLVAAAAGFTGSLWIVVGALAAHGIFDFIHAALIFNPGVPVWWPDFCMAYDVTAAGYLALSIKSGRIRVTI